MSEVYIREYWPDIQDYMDHPRYKECYTCQSLSEDNDDFTSVYMVPEDLYEEIHMQKAPKEIVFDGESYETFWEYVERGDSVLIETKDGEREVVTAATPCKPPLYGHLVFENSIHLPGVTCEILGVKHLKTNMNG